jgi:hypothetical protein
VSVNEALLVVAALVLLTHNDSINAACDMISFVAWLSATSLISDDLRFIVAVILAHAGHGCASETSEEHAGMSSSPAWILIASASNNAPMVPAANPSRQPLLIDPAPK